MSWLLHCHIDSVRCFDEPFVNIVRGDDTAYQVVCRRYLRAPTDQPARTLSKAEDSRLRRNLFLQAG